MRITVKEDISALRREIYNNLKARALSYEIGDNSLLNFYRTSQENLSNLQFTESTIEELLDKAINAQIIYLGDFHTFDQNIRNVLRVIKAIIESEHKCIIGLEMVNSKYQYFLDSFMNGHITELEFLEMIKYHDSWRFPWTHYKLIFDLAKKFDVKLVALNTEGSLDHRDQFAATLISAHCKDNPKSKIIVFYGEYHIVADKIPAQVKSLIPKLNDLIVHQNLDGVYWKQLESKNKSNVVKFSENELCINTAPPWVKYESMIYWYENLCDDPDFDIHEYIIENGTKIFTSDAQENFSLVATQMTEALKIKIDQSHLDDFNLYDHTSLEYIVEKIELIKDNNTKELYHDLLTSGESFRFPNQSLFYCSSYSLNRISYLAGIHIFFCTIKDLDAQKVLKSKNDNYILKFYAQHYLFAYFFSKVINPNRKCDMLKDILKESYSLEQKIKENISLFLNSNFPSKSDLNLTQLANVARFSGHILGEYLYQKVSEASELIDLNLYLQNIKSEFSSFDEFKKSILKGNDFINDEKIYF